MTLHLGGPMNDTIYPEPPMWYGVIHGFLLGADREPLHKFIKPQKHQNFNRLGPRSPTAKHRNAHADGRCRASCEHGVCKPMVRWAPALPVHSEKKWKNYCR
ncbi:uncharacterized protein LOC121824431 [Peromyscus maniculatus bairdii]|uniref:uncharacterized protein LOC121824431 n=1 Tax=Peromyscus maniculatus bairdii TaxID=230844 RepID=UPI003FD2CDAA